MSLSINGDGTLTGVTAIGDVSSTELGYVDGVTSPIQTQINSGGLVLITSDTFTSQTTRSFNNVFTSTYDNYLVKIFLTSVHTAASNYQLKYRSSGVDTSTNYLWSESEVTWAGATNAGGTGSSTFIQIGYSDANKVVSMTVNVYGPNLTGRTTNFAQMVGNRGPRWSGGLQDTATSFDGFSFIVGTGSVSGTIQVYGYKD